MRVVITVVCVVVQVVSLKRSKKRSTYDKLIPNKELGSSGHRNERHLCSLISYNHNCDTSDTY